MRILNFLKLPVLLFICFSLSSAQKEKSSGKYQCLPCGQACDTKMYDEPGKCGGCGMNLVTASTISFKTIGPNSVCDYIEKHPGAILLDVRTKEEFEGKGMPDFGTMKNAINIPVQELERRVTELKEYKTKEIIVYCSHSHRSPQAAYILTQNGFSSVKNMSGGMSEFTGGSCKK
ncbi:MAG: rhodanese-like domain-containing protein [Bacteroidetes bacterium]|nr:rhodanese-like domain-containing protein [Bacteroidota bacterium]